MWIHTTAGFLSIVADPQDAGSVLVRSRDRESMQTLLDGVELIAGHEPPDIRVGEGTDYPYRTSVTRADFAAWIAHEVLNYITYSNFKNAVKDSRGPVWSTALMDTWIAMLRTTDPEVRDLGYYGGQSDNPHYSTNRTWDHHEMTYYSDDDGTLYDALLDQEYGNLEPHRWSSRARDYLPTEDDD